MAILDAVGHEVPIDAVGLFSLLEREVQEEIAWQRDAACRTAKVGSNVQTRVRAFFPDRGRPADRAIAVCATCPVWRECLEYALANHLRDGVFGGTTEKGRRVILRARRMGVPIELVKPVTPKARPTQCCHGPGCDCSEWKRRLESAA